MRTHHYGLTSSAISQMNEEAKRLANHAFGAPFLHMMGYEYDRKAEPWLGNVIGEFFIRKYHNAATLTNAAKAYVSLKLMKRDMETNGADGGPMNPVEAAGALLPRCPAARRGSRHRLKLPTHCCMYSGIAACTVASLCAPAHLSVGSLGSAHSRGFDAASPPPNGCPAEYLENRMGLTITCVWRLLVLDTEAVLDGVSCSHPASPPLVHPASPPLAHPASPPLVHVSDA